MEEISPHYEKHVLVCTNFREERECCAKVEGDGIFFELKRFVKENGLASRIWVTRTGCLGFCNETGTTVVIYPERRWFLKTKAEELDKIKEKLLSNDSSKKNSDKFK